MMGDMGDYWRDVKDSHRAMRERQGWISNKYRTEEERAEWVGSLHADNYRADNDTLKHLKKAGLDAERKSASSFQLHLPTGNVMLYTGRKGSFIYVPQTNTRYEVDMWLDDIKQVVARVVGVQRPAQPNQSQIKTKTKEL